MSKIKSWIKKEKEETEILLRSIPVMVVTLFVVSVICMNLLANKTLLQLDWIALDGGILISWLSFMCMDIITKHFGPKASNKISLLAAGINLLTCLIFFAASIIPSTANDYTAFNNIFGGTWFILLGSTIAFLSSAVLNNMLNWMIGKMVAENMDERVAYGLQTYSSTFILEWISLDCAAVYDLCADGSGGRACYGNYFFAHRISNCDEVEGQCGWKRVVGLYRERKRVV